MKRKLTIIGSALGILIITVGLAVFFAGQKKETEKKPVTTFKKSVQTKPVKFEKIQTEIVSFGRVQTAQTLNILSEVSGRMFQGSVPLKEGQRFRKGQLLFYIDDTEPLLNLKSEKSNFLRDLAGILPDLKIDFPENFDVWNTYFNSLDVNKNFQPLPEVKSEKEKVFLATQGIYSAYYNIKSTEARLAKHRYYAPFDGSIMQVDLQSGSYINAGTSIGEIMKTGVHELKVPVETRDIPWIQENTPVSIYSDEMNKTWTGSVIRISDFVNQNTQSVDVFIAIDAKGEKIYDGQFFQAAIPAHTIENGIMIPRNAIANGNEVYVVQDTLLKIKQIEVLRLADEDAVIQGLSQGEDLVIEPLVGAFENMVVEKDEQKEIDLEIGTSTPQASSSTN